MKSIDALALYLSPFQFESDLDWMSSDEPKVLTISLWFRSSSELGFHFHFQRERNMGTPQKENESKGFFSAMSSRFSVFSNAMHRSVNGYFNSLIHLKTFNFFFLMCMLQICMRFFLILIVWKLFLCYL